METHDDFKLLWYLRPRAHCRDLLDVFTSENGLKAAVGYSFLACLSDFQININLISFNPMSELLEIMQKATRSLPVGFTEETKPIPTFPDSLSGKCFGPLYAGFLYEYSVWIEWERKEEMW